MKKVLQCNNFDNFTKSEFIANLLWLDIECYTDLVGKRVYYMMPEYGVHKVKEWDSDRCEYLLEIDSKQFWSNPFRVYRY